MTAGMSKMFLLMMMAVISTSIAFSPPSLQSGIARSSTSIKALTPTTQQPRRKFLNSVATSTLATIIATSPPSPAHAAATISATDARAQFDAAIVITTKLLKEWDTIATSGDAIRKELGTVGTGSPFFQINKAIKVLQNDAADPVAFGDASEQFEIRLAGADAMAYSANFAGGSGKPTPPSVYILKSRGEVEALKRIEAEMVEAL